MSESLRRRALKSTPIAVCATFIIASKSLVHLGKSVLIIFPATNSVTISKVCNNVQSCQFQMPLVLVGLYLFKLGFKAPYFSFKRADCFNQTGQSLNNPHFAVHLKPQLVDFVILLLLGQHETRPVN